MKFAPFSLWFSVQLTFVRAAWQIISKQFPLSMFITETEDDEISCVTFWCFRSSMDIKFFFGSWSKLDTF